MSLFSVLKNNSKLALRNNWGKAIAALLIGLMVTGVLTTLQSAAIQLFVPTMNVDPTFAMRYGFDEFFFRSLLATAPSELIILGIFTVVEILLLSPLNLGLTHWHFALVHGRSASITEIFRFFETGRAYKRSVWYNINLSVRCFLWAIVFYIVPGAIFTGSTVMLIGSTGDVQRSTAAMATMGILLSCILFLLATIFYSALVNKYALTAYLLCEDENLSVVDAIKQSIAYTKGYRFSLLWFGLSFIGWIVLCFFFFPLLYVAPYMRTATAMYARYIIEKSRLVPFDQTKEFKVEEVPADPENPVWPTSSDELLPPEPTVPQEPIE